MKYSESERDLSRAHALFKPRPEPTVANPSVESSSRPRRRIVREHPAGVGGPQEAATQPDPQEPILATRAVLQELGEMRRPQRRPEPQPAQTSQEPRPKTEQPLVAGRAPSLSLPLPSQALRAYLVRVLLDDGDLGEPAGEIEAVVLRGRNAAEALAEAVTRISPHIAQRHPGRAWRMASIEELSDVLQ